jgi:hypothetical protein
VKPATVAIIIGIQFATGLLEFLVMALSQMVLCGTLDTSVDIVGNYNAIYKVRAEMINR